MQITLSKNEIHMLLDALEELAGQKDEEFYNVLRLDDLDGLDEIRAEENTIWELHKKIKSYI